MLLWKESAGDGCEAPAWSGEAVAATVASELDEKPDMGVIGDMTPLSAGEVGVGCACCWHSWNEVVPRFVLPTYPGPGPLQPPCGCWSSIC